MLTRHTALLLSMCVGCAGAPADPTVVMTSQGPVRGVVHDDLEVFLGIPYAAPPLGSLRFRPPQSPAAFDGTFEATQLGPMCPQFAPDPTMLGGRTDMVTGDEDCLRVNVWTHTDRSSPRPVMVFIHGGAFQFGSGGEPTYESTHIAHDGDVVVVTLNYRLGTLGLLATEALAAEDPSGSAGNYAIQDQIAALHWVHDNIAAFGGDPAQVTIFGESAGGVSVCVLAGSPLATGLFQRAIVESGAGCYGWMDAPSAMTRGAELVSAAGCDTAPDPLACMRAATPEALVRAGAQGTQSALGVPQFNPNIDGVVITGNTFDLFQSGARDLPLMIGSNANEAYIFTSSTPVPTEDAFRTLLEQLFGATLASEVLALYPVADYATPKDAYNAAFTDIAFVCPALAMAATAAGGADPSFTYHFSHPLNGAAGRIGSFHGLELLFVFGNFPDAYTPTDGDLIVATAMRNAWTSFARMGAPITTPMWPAYDPASSGIFLIDDPPQVVPEIMEGRCASLQALGVVRE